MKNLGMLTLAAIAAVALATSDLADAARIGGGKSMGAQRSSIAPQRPATPAATTNPTPANPNAATNPVMPPSTAAAPGKVGAAAPAAGAAAAAAPSGMSRWLGPIAGIAAGLGLAALLSHFGLPEGLGSFLLLALAAIAIVFVVRMFLARRTAPAPVRQVGPMQYAGVTPSGTGGSFGDQSSPWGPPKTDPFLTPVGAAPAETPKIPPDFDVQGFVHQAKLQFNRLQAAYDAGDRKALADVMTPEMYAEVGRELSNRHEHQATEVVSLDAELLEVTTEDDAHWASVRYTGLLRENGEPLPKPIDEVWNLTKAVKGRAGWLLAGIQQIA